MSAQAPLVAVDWSRIATEFHRDREVIQTRRVIEASTVRLADFTAAVGGLVDGRSLDEADLAQSLGSLWAQAAHQQGSTFVLAFALYAEIQHGWELSADTANMLATISATAATWGQHRVGVQDPTEQQLTDLLVRHLTDLGAAFAMENGLNCSCALETQQAAIQVASGSAAVLADLEPAPGPWQEASALLRSVVEAHLVYFDGVGRSSGAILDHVTGAADVAGVREVAQALQHMLQDPRLARDVYQSELRAHVVALHSLVRRLETTTLPGLRFPSLKVTYVVPFTARGATDNLAQDNRELVDAVRRRGRRLVGTGPLAPLQVHDLELSDIWTHGRDEVFSTMPQDPTAYEIVSVMLPDVWIEPFAAGLPAIGPYRVEVRLSSFGNHHLRVSGPVQPPQDDRVPGYHDLNQALRRGSGFMGAERVRVDPGDLVLGSVAQLAFEVVAMISRWDGALGVRQLRCHVDPAVDTHAIITMPEALVEVEGAVRDATGAEILNAVGPLLLIPVERTAAGLEEWLRYTDPSPDASAPNFLGHLAPLDSLAVQTARSTCLYTPGLPDWSLLGTSELIEFVVSVRALIRQWNGHVQEAVEGATAMLRRRLAGEGLSAEEVRSLRLRLADHGALIRQQRALLHSEELARSPGHRHILDNLLRTSHADRLEAELDASIAELDELYGQLGDDASAVEEARTAAYQNLVGLVLFVLTVFSLSDMFGFLNDLLFDEGPPVAVVVLELSLFVAAVIGLAMWGILGYRRSRRG